MGKGSGSKARVVEYRMSIHFGIGHKLDGITEIRVDEKTAWFGDVSSNTALDINQPNLYGGQQKEGGLVGTVQVLLGADDQVLPAAAAERYGRAPMDCPAFRGITTLMFHGSAVVSTGRPFEWLVNGGPNVTGGGFLWKMNSPVIGQKVEITGYRAPVGLNPAVSMSPDRDANFVSIIYECLTNTEWGMGGLPSLINTAGFEAEAARLAAEGMFGSVWWLRQTDIETFIVEMLTHIQATLFLNPNSGLLDIKLLRDDYDIENLRHITPSNAALSNFKRRSSGEIVNEMTITWTNPVTEQGESITAQDIASIENQGGEKVSGSGNYYAIRKQELAIKVLQRDLRASTAPLVSADAALDRSAWDLLPGEVVLMSWPKRQTYSTVMRIGKVNYGRPVDSKIRVSMLQDVFSLEKPPIAILPGSGWVDPRVPPEPLTMQLFTVPSYFARNAELQTSQVVLDESEALVGALADSSTYDSFDYELISESLTAAGETVFTSKGAMSMTGLAYLSVAIPAGATSVLPRTLYPIPDEAPKEGGFVLLGYGDENQEFALVTGQVDEGWTLSRGCLDTTPRNWPAGTPVWVINPGVKIVDTQTVHGEGTTATYRALDRTALGVLPIDDAPPVSIVVTDRPNMPLRPANVKVNGVGFGPVPIGAADTITVSWATRNRLLEDTQVLNWTDGPITPEYRQETVIRFYDFSNTLIVEYDGFWDQESYDFPSSYFDKYASVIVEVAARRDGVDSLVGHRITITGLPGDIGAPPPGPGVNPSDPPSYIPAPAVGTYEITGNSTFGGESPAILVSGTPDNRSATQLLIRYRVAPGPDNGAWTITTPYFLNHNRQTHVADLGLVAQTNYEVEVSYIVGTTPSRWRNIGQVTTGGTTVESLVGRLETVEEIAAQNQAAVANLETIYGDTVSAAASAAAAAQAKADAILAKADAVQAKTDAVAAAGASASSASQAGGFKTAAETASAAATNASVTATTAKNRAEEGAANASYLDPGAVYTLQNSNENWGVSGGTLTPSPGGSLLVSTSNDPQVSRGASILGSRYTRIIISLTRTKARTSGAWDGTVYYSTSGHGYSGSYRKVIARDPAVGEKTELTWDMSSLTFGGDDWLTNTITALRFDLDNGPGGEFTIHSIRVVGADTAAPAKSASASATSASNAAASETAAGLSATASQTARTGAETARGQAETYRNETASARDTAVSSAATATTQAGISASSAAASQAAANSPLATSPALSPDAFSINDWLTLNASPNLREVFANNPGKIYPINSTVEVNNLGSAIHINAAKAMARPEGHRVRYSARIRRMAEGGDASQNNVTLFALFWDANGNQIGGATLFETNPGTAQGTQTLTVEHLPPAGTAWTRTMLRVYSVVGVTAVLSLDTQDIESEKTATAAATASVASASTASTKADEAGASASAASAAKIASELARDNASGSASASATSAGQSLTYRNQAGEFASASSGSATTAATKAGEAATSASQASTSAGNANTAAINAGVSATTAKDAAARVATVSLGANPLTFGWNSYGSIPQINDLTTYVAENPANGSFVNGNFRLKGVGIYVHSVPGTVRTVLGNKYKITAQVRRIAGTEAVDAVVFASLFDANGVALDRIAMTAVSNFAPEAGVQTIVGYLSRYGSATEHAYVNSAFIRPMLQIYGNSGASTVDLISLGIEDVTESAAAASSAAAATTSAASASSSAAAASVSANLAASVSANASVVNNGNFLNWPNGQARPTGWDDWANANQAPNIQVGSGWNSRRVASMSYQPSMNDLGMKQRIDGFRGVGTYNLEVEVAIPFGGATGTGFQGAGVLIQCMDANFNYIADATQLRFATDPNTGGNVAGSGSGDGKIYRFSKRLNLAPNTASIQLYLMTRWSGFGPTGANEAKILDWYSCALSSASESDRAVPALAASLSVTAAVAADAQTRLSSARFEVIAAAGSDPAQLLIRADTSGSLAALVASEIAFSNVIGGQIIRVMRIQNGIVFITGKLVIGNPTGARLEIDGPNMRIDVYDANGTLRVRLGNA